MWPLGTFSALERLDSRLGQRVQPLVVFVCAQPRCLLVEQLQVQQCHPHGPLVERLQYPAAHLPVARRVVHEEGVVVRVDDHVEQTARLVTAVDSQQWTS